MLDKFRHINIPERPAFMQLVEAPTETLINDGYILQIDKENLSVNIIKLKKGGERTMATKVITKAKPKFEALYEELIARKEELDSKKETAINEAIAKVTAEVEAEFASEELTLDNMLKEVTVEETIEVEDEPEATEVVGEETVAEVAEENVAVEGQPVNTAQIF